MKQTKRHLTCTTKNLYDQNSNTSSLKLIFMNKMITSRCDQRANAKRTASPRDPTRRSDFTAFGKFFSIYVSIPFYRHYVAYLYQPELRSIHTFALRSMANRSRISGTGQREAGDSSAKKENEYPPIYLNDRARNAEQGFADNLYRTTRYSWWNFVPKNIFEQFRRFTNIYFLIVIIITCIPSSK